jgi:predicted nucleic-acid-binding protein
MVIDNELFVRLVRVLEQKEKEVAQIKNTISNGILDENDLKLGVTIKLRNKANNNVVIGTLLDAAVIKVGTSVHKGLIVRPNNVYESMQFSLADYTIESVTDTAENDLIQF